MLTNNKKVTGEGTAPRTTDFKIENQGTIIVFTPLTKAAEAFLERCDTAPWQWMGPSLVVDHRPAGMLLYHIKDEGLSWEVA
jgi:hypothetical protein